MLELSHVTIRYSLAKAEGAATRPHELAFSGSTFAEDGNIAAGLALGAETIELRVQALAPVRLEAAEVVLNHDFSATEEVLLNGYQTWTDTAWRPAWNVMRGLDGVPGPIVRKYVLDGGGDYRFCDYPKRRGCMHGWTYAAFRKKERFCLVGSLDEDDGLTLVRTDASAGTVTLSAECPPRVLEPGEEAPAGRYAVIEDAPEAAYDRWFELSGVRPRPAAPLIGYSSWYRHYEDIDDVKMAHDLAGTCNALSKVKAEGCVKAFQIDDGWCRKGDWMRPDAARFPEGMAPLAGKIAEAGLVPGLWAAPFVCERDSNLFREHPDWLLRDGSGEPVGTGSHWSGAFALDTLNPQVRAYVRDALRTIVEDWGFRLLKLDFLYAACMLPHGGMNRGQLMADALDLLRSAVGEGTAVIGCGVPLGPAFGRLEYCRIGCDVTLDWDDKPPMRLLHRERSSTKVSLGDTLARGPLNGRAFGNDPDVVILRDDVKLSEGQRARLAKADAQYGSVLLTSDDMGAWNARQLSAFQHAVDVLSSHAKRG